MILTDFIYYNLKVAALLAVFYLFYQLLLSRETTHSLNRLVLLAIIVLSTVLPLCVVTLHRSVAIEAMTQAEAATPTHNIITAAPIKEAVGHASLETWIVFALLVLGIIIRLAYVAHGYRQLRLLMASGEHHTLPSGTQVCVVDTPIAPSSWMHTIVLPRAEWPSPSASVLAHEEAHVCHHHSYDVVVVEVLTALQWFNPVVWFLRQELRTLHEYEADATVLSSGFNESQYIHLLMQKAMGIQACTFVNGINTHRTKKRIMMMLKPKSNQRAWLKALYVVPIVLTSLALSAKTVTDYETATPAQAGEQGKTIYVVDGEQISQEAASPIPKENIAEVTVISNKEWCSRYAPDADRVVFIKTHQAEDPIFDLCEVMPLFPGGEAKLMEFIARNIRYPQVAHEHGVQGRVQIQFIVEKDGSLTHPVAIEDSSPSGVHAVVVTAQMTEQQRKSAENHNAGVQALKDEALRVISAMPKWTPGKLQGKAVRVRFTIPVTYRLN